MSLLKSSDNINVGEHTYYNGDIKLVASGKSKINIGKYCSIGSNLKIITLNHDYNYPSLQGKFYKNNFNDRHPGETNIIPTKERTKGHVYIGNDVWLGDDVTILSGIKIGDGCCIGTKSLITKDMPPYTICGGIPCRIIKNRYPEKIKQFLLKIKWWNWSSEKIKLNKKFFFTNLNSINPDDLSNIII